MPKRKFFSGSDVAGFAWDQVKFRLSGSENAADMADATEVALSFVAGHEVTEVVQLGREIFDERIVGKVYPQTLALARGHLDAGQRVWLVSAAPVELATIIAKRLGLTGALGTVSETSGGVYTGRLVGRPLHGPAKAEAVRALAEREGLDLARCAAYSDSSNDIPMLSLVGIRSPSTPTSASASTRETWAGGSTTTGPGARPRRSACPAQPRPARSAGDRHHRRGRRPADVRSALIRRSPGFAVGGTRRSSTSSG